MPRTSNSSQAIAAHAAQAASTLGLHAISVGGIANAVGMSKGGVCANFPNKQALQLAAVQEAETLFRAAVFGPAQGHPVGLPQLEAMCEAWFLYLANRTFEGGCFFTNVLLTNYATDAVVQRAITRAYERYLAWIERSIRSAISLGHLRADVDAAALAFAIHGHQMATLVWRAMHRASALSRGRAAMRQTLAAARP